MNAFYALLINELRIFSRDRLAMFFTFLFPLVFILIFGFLMRDVGDVNRAKMGLVMSSSKDEAALLEAVEDAGTMTLVPVESEETVREAVAQRALDFAVLWDGTVLHFFYDANRIQENAAYEQAARGIAAAFDFRRQQVARPLPVQQVHVGMIESVGWFNLMLPGILAFSVLSAGLFAVSGHLTQMKERNILDRLIVTPMPAVALLQAIAVVRLVIVFLSTLITLGVGIFAFDLKFDVDWLRYVALVLCATLGTMGMGTVIALVVRRPSSASSLANALAMVMMFFAGVYFPVEFMPAYLRVVSRALPLTHMANAMRYVTGVLEMSELEFWSITMSLLAVAAVLFPLLSRYVVRPLRR